MPAASAPNSVTKASRHQRQQEADDIARPDAERVKHVGGLRDAGDEIAIGDHDRLVGRIGIGEELHRRRIGIVGGAELDRLIGALGSDAVRIRDLFESPHLGIIARSDIRCR